MITPDEVRSRQEDEHNALRRKTFAEAIEHAIGEIPEPLLIQTLSDGTWFWQWTDEYRLVKGKVGLCIEKLIGGQWIRFPNHSDGGYRLYVVLVWNDEMDRIFAWFDDYATAGFWRRRKLLERGILDDTEQRKKKP